MAQSTPPSAEILSCPIAERCGGCALIERSYGRQLEIKTERVRAALAEVLGAAAPEVEVCVPAPVRSAYRNRAKLAVGFQAGDLRIGLFERGTHRIVDLSPCRVQHPALLEALRRLRDWIGRFRLAAPAGPVFYVDLRRLAGDRVHVTLVLSRETRRLPIDRLLEGWTSCDGVALNLGNPASSYALGDSTRNIRGRRLLRMELPRRDADAEYFDVPAGGFFQVGPAALEEVHGRMADHLGEEGPLLDLYCGVGVHGQALRPGAPLVGIESDRAAVQAAERNARRRGLDAAYIEGRVEEQLADCLHSHRPRRVILNPGRSGCGRGVMETLAAAPVARLAYLSCNPTTLARDLKSAVEAGMNVGRVTPIDLMPQTDHVEVLALLVRAGQKKARRGGLPGRSNEDRVE